MNPDRLHNAPATESFKENPQQSARLLLAAHESEHDLMIEAGKTLRQEGKHQEHNEQLLKAWNLHLDIEKNLKPLTAKDGKHSFTSHESALLEEMYKKNDEYNEIKDYISGVLAKLGYVVEEVTLETNSPTAEVNVENSIEKLTELYKNADPSVFVDNIEGGKGRNKKFEVINDEIRMVLRTAGFDQDKIKIFMNETVKPIRSQVRQKSIQQSETSDKTQKQELRAAINQNYKELLDKVAAFMREEKVDESENPADTKGSGEEAGVNIDQAVESVLQEFELFKQSGAYTKNPAFIQAKKAVERLAQLDEKDPAVAANKKEKYLRVLTEALARLRAQSEAEAVEVQGGATNTETLAEKIKSLAREYRVFIDGLHEDYPKDATDLIKLESIFSDFLIARNKQETIDRASLLESALAEAESEYRDWVSQQSKDSIPTVLNSSTADEHKDKYLDTVHAYTKSKESFKESDLKYKDAMRAYYQDSSWRAKFRNGLDGVKKVFGINPELPPALQAMRAESRHLRSVYAASLAGVLKERGERGENTEFDLTDDRSKVAFGRKFILKPNQEMLKLQEGALPPETVSRVGKIMQTFSKYKWHTRVGTVALAGAVGFASGGVGALLAGAGYQAWKIAASVGAGAGAGLLTRKAMHGRTEAAWEGLASAEARVSKKFSLANLDELETKLEQAQSIKNIRERQQKVATIAAAVAAGGLTGYGLSQFNGGSSVPESTGGLSQEALERLVANELGEPSQSTMPTTESAAATVAPVSTEAVQVQNVEVVPEASDFKLGTFTIPHYGESGEKLYETVIANTKIVGEFSAGNLTEATQLELEKFIKLSMEDALHAHPNLSEAKLEAEVLSKLEAKYGNTPWFTEAGITKIDIGSMTVEEHASNASTSSSEVFEQPISGGNRVEVNIGSSDSADTEAGPVRSEEVAAVEAEPGTYVVQKGDTLFEIIETRYAEQLNDIPVEKRGVILEQLLTNIEANSTLRDSIGMRSGDIDLIYANEKINLDGIEDELSRLIEREQILEIFRTSGPLSVEADTPVEEVPITIVEKGAPAVTEIKTETEALPAVVERSVGLMAPRPVALDGLYAEHPNYKEYIQNTFGSLKAFEVTVEKSVQNFDNSTYDVFERPGFFGGANYESPYRFLGEMTLKEVAEFETQPNEEIRAFLNENNIKYDTYLAWLDQIDLMVQTLPNQPKTTVSDLFERYVAETQIPKANTLIK